MTHSPPIPNEFLRHTLATLDYRFRKSVKNAPDGFGPFSLGKGSRTPEEIIFHMYQVLQWTAHFIEHEAFPSENPEKLSLEGEIERFLDTLRKTDALLSRKELGMNYAKKLLQGPFSDMLTHVGQLSMLQRLAGNPVPGEDFSSADISTGFS